MADCQHTCKACAAWNDVESIRRRFEAKIVRSDAGCWLWTGYRNSRGYGRLNVGQMPEYAHRVSVRLSGRSLPDGMQVDHLCSNPSCVNPDHLEVVSGAVNTRRRFERSHPVGASGIPGVCWHKGKGKWRVKVKGRHVGEFSTLDAAAAAASDAWNAAQGGA